MRIGVSFSRVLAVNRAVAQSHGDIVVVHDADMLPDWAAIERAATVADRRGWSLIYSLVQMLSPEETGRFIEHGELPTLTEHPVHVYLCPGLIAVRRDLWESVGGMDERFGTGYGYEDCALRNLLASKVGTDNLDDWYPSGILRGLYHVHAGAPSPENDALFWREYANLAPELN